MNLSIVNYGLGNLYSLANAFDFIGQHVDITNDSTKLHGSDALILPGVGAFADGMARLKDIGLDTAIREFADLGKKILGIRLGMQLFMDSSKEFGDTEGLGLIPGKVKSFHNMFGFDHTCKVPHVGWNNLIAEQENPILRNIDKMEMYFVHSYVVETASQEDTAAWASYGNVRFCAVINRGNIFGCQFHPEKSSESGLRVIKNFLEIV